MIKKEEVMALLIEACPSYKSRAEEYIRETYDTGEERLYYLEISDFVDHMTNLFRGNKTEEYEGIFDVVEKLHIDGDDYVKELATIGFLESLQHEIIGDYNSRLTEIENYLKLESLIWWKHLNNFWSGKTAYVGGPLK